MRERLTVGSMEGLGRVERTDGDVVPVRISERKFCGSSAGIHVWLFFQPADESARPWQSYVKVVDPEEQEEAVSRLGVVGACQRRMLVGTPLVETEQHRSIRVEDLPEVVVGRSRLRQAK
jgi:DNA-directed RNA polymerase subunit N (RpoN/RPB10)